MRPIKPTWRQFGIGVLMVSIWINISEVFRYFVIVRPKVQHFFNFQEGIAEMNGVIFLIWGFWDMLLTLMVYGSYVLFVYYYGDTRRAIVPAATFSWLFLFVLFWIAMANMGLSNWSTLGMVLPLCWIETFVASIIGSWLLRKNHLINPNSNEIS